VWRAGRADGRWGNLAAIFVSVTIDYAKGSPYFGKGIRVSNDLKLTERIKRLVIIAMVSDDELLEKLVLKGGNLLDIAYGVSTRSSVDIDFSVDGDVLARSSSGIGGADFVRDFNHGFNPRFNQREKRLAGVQGRR
jgi:hypothetical protein